MADGYSLFAVIATEVVLLPLVWLTVCTRVYVKLRIVKNFSADDWVMLLSTIIFSGLCALGFVSATLGLGKHEDSLPASNVAKVYELWFFSELVYVISTVTVKISIAIMLLRLSSTKRVAWYIITGTATLYTLVGVAGICIIIFQCIPVQKYWDKSESGTCISRTVFAGLFYGYAGLSTATDLIFAVVPIWLVSDLQLDKSTKLSVSFVLGLGLITVVVNAARFGWINTLALPADSTYVLIPIAILSVLEVGLGIIAGSMATFRPLLKKLGGGTSSRNATVSRQVSERKSLTKWSDESKEYARSQKRTMPLDPERELFRRTYHNEMYGWQDNGNGEKSGIREWEEPSPESQTRKFSISNAPIGTGDGSWRALETTAPEMRAPMEPKQSRVTYAEPVADVEAAEDTESDSTAPPTDYETNKVDTNHPINSRKLSLVALPTSFEANTINKSYPIDSRKPSVASIGPLSTPFIHIPEMNVPIVSRRSSVAPQGPPTNLRTRQQSIAIARGRNMSVTPAMTPVAENGEESNRPSRLSRKQSQALSSHPTPSQAHSLPQDRMISPSVSPFQSRTPQPLEPEPPISSPSPKFHGLTAQNHPLFQPPPPSPSPLSSMKRSMPAVQNQALFQPPPPSPSPLSSDRGFKSAAQLDFEEFSPYPNPTTSPLSSPRPVAPTSAPRSFIEGTPSPLSPQPQQQVRPETQPRSVPSPSPSQQPPTPPARQSSLRSSIAPRNPHPLPPIPSTQSSASPAPPANLAMLLAPAMSQPTGQRKASVALPYQPDGLTTYQSPRRKSSNRTGSITKGAFRKTSGTLSRDDSMDDLQRTTLDMMTRKNSAMTTESIPDQIRKMRLASVAGGGSRESLSGQGGRKSSSAPGRKWSVMRPVRGTESEGAWMKRAGLDKRRKSSAAKNKDLEMQNEEDEELDPDEWEDDFFASEEQDTDAHQYMAPETTELEPLREDEVEGTKWGAMNWMGNARKQSVAWRQHGNSEAGPSRRKDDGRGRKDSDLLWGWKS